MKKELKFSKVTSRMFQEIEEERKNRKFPSVNFVLLFSGLINVRDEDDPDCEESPLEKYFFTLDILPSEIDSNLSLQFLSAETQLKVRNETNVKKKSKKDRKKKKSTTPSTFSYTYLTEEEKKCTIKVDSNVKLVMEKLYEVSTKFSADSIEPIHIIVALFMADLKENKDFFKELGENYVDAKSFFRADKILKLGCIPYMLSSFLQVMNDKVNVEKPCEILKREKETETLWNIMLKKNKRNTVIVGEAGVGKTALIEKITYEIRNNTAPKEFKNYKVISLDVNALIAGTSYRGDAEERIKEVIAFLQKHHDVILFIDEVHTILGAGSCFEGEMDLANALKPILARGETIVIGATTNEEYEKYFAKDAALSRRFEKLEVKEPLVKDVPDMIRNKIQALSEYHGISIEDTMVKYAIMIAGCFAFERKNPDKTLDLIDRSMVSAKRKNKKSVDKDSIIENFAIYMQIWNNMSFDSKKEVAYHEAGHYIVGKASGRLIRYHFLAVSIMPAENYLGITVAEEDETQIPFCDENYFIDDIAFDLGGRVSEEFFRHTYTSGAKADLDNATNTAYQVITKFGLGNNSIKNRIYVNYQNNPMFSEKSIDVINHEIDQIIEKALKRATDILTENRDVVEALVSALLQNHIMSSEELDAIWKETITHRNS